MIYVVGTILVLVQLAIVTYFFYREVFEGHKRTRIEGLLILGIALGLLREAVITNNTVLGVIVSIGILGSVLAYAIPETVLRQLILMYVEKRQQSQGSQDLQDL